MTKYFIHIFIFIILSISSSFAETFEVEMLNKHEGQINVFNPPIVRVAVGDTVNWTSVNPGHNIAILCPGFTDVQFTVSPTATLTIGGLKTLICPSCLFSISTSNVSANDEEIDKIIKIKICIKYFVIRLI